MAYLHWLTLTPELESSQQPIPRGRHAPPLEVRLEVQKHRLFDAAAIVFSRVGYADASAEAISRQAGMSKATFYEHFANKEECLIALFEYATASLVEELVAASRGAERRFEERHSAGLHAILAAIEDDPAMAQAILVETVGAGPRLAELRIAALNGFAQVMYDQTVQARPSGPAARRTPRPTRRSRSSARRSSSSRASCAPASPSVSPTCSRSSSG